MKLNKYIFAFGILCALSLSSCDSFLDEKPESEKGTGQAWKTQADAKTGVNALYTSGPLQLNNEQVDGGWTPKATMWGGVMSGLFVDKRKDRTFTNASEGCNFNVESFDATSKILWKQLYNGVSRANALIENVPKMTSVLTTAEITDYIAQGKFFRAYSYFYLVKEYGGVPYITKPYVAAEGMDVPRTDAAEIYKNIEQDLIDAIAALPASSFYTNKGYITKSTAQTLLAQVYLQWAGAPLNGGNEYYVKAANMAKEVVAGGQHALVQAEGSSDDLNSAFNVIKTTKASNEIIFAKEYNQKDLSLGSSYVCRSIGSDAFQWGVFKPAGDVLYNAYLPSSIILNSYLSTDIRNHEKQFFFYKYTDKEGTTYTLNNAGSWSWFDETALIEGRDGDYNIPVMRYSEVLLIAAEGLARTGSDAEAKTFLNQVRKRAGIADETATGTALVEAILTERLHELPLEFRVWDDIRRTRLYPEADGEQSGKLKWVSLTSAQIQNKPEGVVKQGAIPEYALLWPIPLYDMQANTALVGHQNPGWN